MSGLIVQKVADWPSEETSPYVHWWTQVDKLAGTREFDDVHNFGELTFSPWDGGTQLEGRPVSETRAVARTLPMWRWALPSGKNSITVPVGGFADPFDRSSTRPAAVLVVIDTAINPLHERFRGAEGLPRVLAHWMMEGKYKADPLRVPFGRENRTWDLEEALSSKTEEAALRHLGSHSLEQPFAPRGTAQLAAHGTHVLDLAAGTDPVDPAPEAKLLRAVPILCVSLPSNRLLSPSGAFLEAFVDQAIRWVEQRLDELFADGWPPVVLNLSYGLSAGSKDGGDFLPRRICAFLTKRPTVRMFMPAGNDGHSHVHARLGGEDGCREIGWLVMPSDPFSAYAEVWTTGASGQERLHLIAPGGHELATERLAMMDPDTAWELARPIAEGARPVVRFYPLGRDQERGRYGVLFCVAPTQHLKSDAPVAPAGIWRLRLTGKPGGRADVHLQSERPLTPGSLAGRPSRLVPVSGIGPTREGTLNALAVGSGARVVDASRGSDGSRVPWSSQGDLSYQPPFWADEIKIGDRSLARPGLLAAGYRSGSRATVQGTSFACASATRAALLAVLEAVSDR